MTQEIADILRADDLSLLPLSAVLQRMGYTKAGLYRAIARGDAPKPLLRNGRSLWLSNEIDAAIAKQVRELPRAVRNMGPNMGRKRRAA